MAEPLNLFEDFQAVEDHQPGVGIDGLIYRPGFLTLREQEAALAAVDAGPWQNDLKRRVQHYGYRYDYRARRVDVTMCIGDLPEFALSIAHRLVADGMMAQRPDQLIVNEYLPGQGITAHIDCEPCFGPRITTVSLGWAYEMDFIHVHTRAVQNLLLAPGSALAITDAARYQWLHQIRARKSDRGIPRKRRVSLTFRTVVLSS